MKQGYVTVEGKGGLAVIDRESGEVIARSAKSRYDALRKAAKELKKKEDKQNGIHENPEPVPRPANP